MLRTALLGRRLFVLFIGVAVLFVSFGFIENQHASAQEKYYAPALNVPIPGLDFTEHPIEKSEGSIAIPFFGVYVYAIYLYLLSIVVITATVMFIYGAFLYLLGSAITSIQSGKAIMKDSIAGMLLILASYTILSVINPTLIELKLISVIPIDPIAFAGNRMVSTEEDTQTPDAIGGGASLTSVATGDCPLQLPVDYKRGDFYSAVLPTLTQSTWYERMLAAGDTAVKCGVSLGFCGQVGGTLWTLSGVGPPDCLYDQKAVCRPHETLQKQKGMLEVVHTISNPVAKKLLGLNCNNDCSEKYKQSDCVEDRGASIVAAKDMIKEDGYPDSWADDLQPGDNLWYYNGNKDCAGQHTVTFIGWESPGKARVFSGSWGKPVRYSSVCLKRSCGNWMPLTRVFRPTQSALVQGN